MPPRSRMWWSYYWLRPGPVVERIKAMEHALAGGMAY